jgi:uncharacterized coiled-coil DUF342 family protein
MFIEDKTILSEKNYEGTRLLKIEDEKIISLHKELNALQKEANPFLEKMEALTPKLDETYTKIGVLQKEIDELKKSIQPTKDLYDVELKQVEAIDQRATLVKNKIQPLATELFKKDLKEFEVANQILVKDDVLYVEVTDKLEDFIKGFRANKK